MSRGRYAEERLLALGGDPNSAPQHAIPAWQDQPQPGAKATNTKKVTQGSESWQNHQRSSSPPVQNPSMMKIPKSLNSQDILRKLSPVHQAGIFCRCIQASGTRRSPTGCGRRWPFVDMTGDSGHRSQRHFQVGSPALGKE